MDVPIDKIYALIKKLPKPKSVYNLSSDRFEVYRVKDLFKSRWPNPVLKKLLLVARSSYARYGKRSLLDEYDAKSAIYLVRAVYGHDENPGGNVEEWLSVRFTPGNGHPWGNGELEIYSFSGRSVAEYARARLGLTKTEFVKVVLSSSRMCGIHPYISPPVARTTAASSKHKYTPICFALVQDQFYKDYGYPYKYITEILRPDFAEKGLILSKEGQSFKPASTAAHQLLGLKKEDIELNMAAYAYAFPLYWLNIPNLLALMSNLMESGDITSQTLRHYLGVESIGDIKDEARLRLKKLLSAKGRLVGSKITGDNLRNLVKAQVGHVPELKINDPIEWRKSIQKIIEVSGVKLV